MRSTPECAFPGRAAAAEGVAVPSCSLPVPGLIQLECCSLDRADPTALPELFLEGFYWQMTEDGNVSAAKDRGGGDFCSFRDYSP